MTMCSGMVLRGSSIMAESDPCGQFHQHLKSSFPADFHAPKIKVQKSCCTFDICTNQGGYSQNFLGQILKILTLPWILELISHQK
jgi:hypothetical protein